MPTREAARPNLDEYPVDLERDDCWISVLKVLQSGAGFYIGRTCIDKAGGFMEPYSRETDYYATREAAQLDLDAMTFSVRGAPENEAAYDSGVIPRPKVKAAH